MRGVDEPVCLLMYHSVGGTAGAYDVAPLRFAEHLLALEDVGARVASLHAVIVGGALPAGSGPVVVVTFDDGDVTVARRVGPALAARAWPATLYAVSDWIGRPGFVDAHALADLVAAGWTIGSHGVSHRLLVTLSDRELQAEWRDSKASLEGTLGVPVAHAALPGGRGGVREARAARGALYHSLATSVPGRYGIGTDPFLLPRVAVKRGTTARDVVRAVTGVPSFYRRRWARYAVLDAGKRVLGDARYDQLWQRLRGSGT